MDITTIGALVGITKSVIDTLKSLQELVKSSDTKRIVRESQSELTKVNENFDNFRKRLTILSIQLEQSENLTRMLNAWLEVARLMPMWTDGNKLTSDDIQRIDSNLRGFIRESVGDHFSSIFFSSNFNQLPGIEREIDIFRAKLHDLDRTINAIPPGKTKVFKGLWGTITTQFNDLRNKAQEISRLADNIQGSLIHELREAAEQ